MFDNQAFAAVRAIAAEINVPVEALMAVVTVESNGVAYANVNGKNEPLIRFEGHYFDRLVEVSKRAIARAQKLANPKAGAIPNSKSQATRYAVLDKAKKLDEDAAIMSHSWGVGQVMGSHWKELGYKSAKEFEWVVRSGLAGQISVMAAYITRFGLVDELQRLDWSGFARGYNGPNYRKYAYDTKMRDAYEAFGGSVTVSKASGMIRMGSKGAAVREIQALLVRAGYSIKVDGDYGPATKDAVRMFQSLHELEADGVVGPKTMAALNTLKTAPEEQPGKETILESTAGKVGAGATATGIGVTVAADKINEIADKVAGAGVPAFEWVSAVLYSVAGVIVVAGLAWAAYETIKSGKTFEGLT